MKKIALSLVLAFVSSLAVYAQLSTFSHKYEALVNNTTAQDFVDKQVLLVLPANTWLSAGKIKADASDLRFASDCEGENTLDYFIEDAAIVDDKFKVWVLVDNISANSSTSIFVFTGDASAVSESSFDDVFPPAQQLVISDTISPADEPGLSDGTYTSIEITATGAIVSEAPEDGVNNIVLNAERIIVSGALLADEAGYDGSIASADYGPGTGAIGFGGGGASYGVSGGAGDNGAAPGAVYALTMTDTIQMGSAGGGGELTSFINIGLPSSAGGSGGGAIALRAQFLNLTNSAVVSVNGMNGEDAAVPAVGLTTNFTTSSAGGGAAGGVLLSAKFFQGAGDVSAKGGNGGNSSQSAGVGGGGAGGYVKIYADDIFDASTYNLNGGNGGVASGGPVTAPSGAMGVVETGAAFYTDLTSSLSGELTSIVTITEGHVGSICPADTAKYSASPGFPNYEFFIDEGTGFTSVQNGANTAFDYINPVNNAQVFVYGYTSGGCEAFSDTLNLTVDPEGVADFTVTQNDLEVTIINKAQNNTGFELNMGDGTILTVGDTIVHTYATVGMYDITQVAFNACLNDTLTQTIDVQCGTFSANFNFTVNALTASFTQTGLGNSVSQLWDFGDGATATVANPSHTYASNGIYDVTLIVNNACGEADTIVIPVDLNCPPPAPDFDFSILGYVADFTDMSANGVDYAWDFGDGNTSTLVNPTHDYVVEGTYTVELTLTNPCGIQSVQKIVDVVCPKPVADFDFTLTAYTVDFNLLTTDADSVKWSFGDGVFSQQDSPSHTYAYEDDFSVKLVVYNICGVDSVTKTVTVNCPLPVPSFSFIFDENNYEFYNETAGATSFEWDLKDGGTSTDDTVAVTFTGSGLRNICITADNACGTKQFCQNIDVQCLKNTTILISNTDSGYVFVATDTLSSYLWNFGDGTTSNEMSPTHKFPNSSDQNFTVCLKGVNACGDLINEVCDTFYITNIASTSTSTTLSIYPNPVVNTLNISAYSGAFTVYTLMGKEALKGTTTGKIDVSQLRPGAYVVEVIVNGTTLKSKFVK